MTQRRKTRWMDRLREDQRSVLAFGVLVITLLAIVLALTFFL